MAPHGSTLRMVDKALLLQHQHTFLQPKQGHTTGATLQVQRSWRFRSGVPGGLPTRHPQSALGKNLQNPCFLYFLVIFGVSGQGHFQERFIL